MGISPTMAIVRSSDSSNIVSPFTCLKDFDFSETTETSCTSIGKKICLIALTFYKIKKVKYSRFLYQRFKYTLRRP